MSDDPRREHAPRPPEDDPPPPESDPRRGGNDPRHPRDYDRDFERLISGLELDDPRTGEPWTGEPWTGDRRGSALAEPPPAARRPDRSAAEPSGGWFRMDEALDQAHLDPEPEPGPDEYKPRALPPMQRPSLPVAIGWLCLSYTVATMVLTIVGVALPAWMGYLAAFTFCGAIAVLLWRLPRGPRDDDGAVV